MNPIKLIFSRSRWNDFTSFLLNLIFSVKELFHFMIRKEPRKLVIKTYKAVVFQYAIDFLQQLSVSAFVRRPDHPRTGCLCI